MNRLSRFNLSSFSACATPAEFGRLAAQFDHDIDAYLADNEIVPEYTEFFEGDEIVSFNEEEWAEFVVAYRKVAPQ